MRRFHFAKALFILMMQAPGLAAADQATFRFANTREIESLDPAHVDGTDANIIARGLFEGLLTINPETLEVAPGVAKSWSISKDGLNYTFHLNPAAQWTNGRKVTAADFIYAWRRNMDAATGAFYAPFLDHIAGAKDYRTAATSSSRNFDKVGIKAQGDHALSITLAAPAPYFLEMLSYAVFYPVPQETIRQHGKQWMRPEHIVSNGPFRLETWRLKEKIVLEKNPSYHDAKEVRLDKVEVYPIEDPKTAWNMYQAGQIDWARSIPSSLVPALKSHPEYHSAKVMNTVYLRLNTSRLKDPRVRQAISMAIDRKVLTEKVIKEGQEPAYNFIAPGLKGYTPVARIEENQAEAKRLLAAAGFPDGRGFPQLQLLYTSSSQFEKTALALSTMLKRSLNINVSPKNLERGVFYDKLNALGYDIARSDWTIDATDPRSYLEKFTSHNTFNNLTGYADPSYDRLVGEASLQNESARRYQLFAQAEKKLVVDDAVIVPLYFNVSSSLWKPYVKGLVDNPRLFYSLKAIRIEPKLAHKS